MQSDCHRLRIFEGLVFRKAWHEARVCDFCQCFTCYRHSSELHNINAFFQPLSIFERLTWLGLKDLTQSKLEFRLKQQTDYPSKLFIWFGKSFLDHSTKR